MEKSNSPETEILSYNEKMVGRDVFVIKNGGWRGKVEEVVDKEYFMISNFQNPSAVERVSMYDIRSLSYETL